MFYMHVVVFGVGRSGWSQLVLDIRNERYGNYLHHSSSALAVPLASTLAVTYAGVCRHS